LIEEPMAAAIGAGLPITEPAGCMIVDIGGGTTEVAVISLGGIVVARSIRIAGDEMDTNIAQYTRQKHNLLIGERMAEEVKIAAGNAYYGLNGRTPDQRVVVRGRDLVSGLPAELEMGGDEIREAIAVSVNSIVDAVTDTIEETPPELVADMMARGITLAGGGSLLPGLADLLARKTKMQVHLAEDPLGCVVRGTGKVLNELEVLRKVLVDQNSGRPLYRR
jgi:rod shape-determining protein MreB